MDGSANGTDPGRRMEDDSLAVRVVVAVTRWWRGKAGLISKTLSIILTAGSILATAFSAGAGVVVVFGKWEGLPSRVTDLEAQMARHRDSVTAPALERLEAVEGEVEDLNTDLASVRKAIEDALEGIEGLKDMARWNNCLLRVQAGEISRFECGPKGGGGP